MALIQPDNFGPPRKLVPADGSHTVLKPEPLWNELMWRRHFDNGVTDANLAFEKFDVRVVKNGPNHGDGVRVEFNFESQSSFAGSSACSGTVEMHAILYSVAGDVIQPAPMRVIVGIEKHEAYNPHHFSFGPIHNYDLDQVGSLELIGLNCDGNCGD